MPPRKKKNVKTPQKSKSSTPSAAAAAATIDPVPTSPEPSLASDSVLSADSTIKNDQQPVLEPEPGHGTEAELEVKPSPEQEVIDTTPEASNPPSEEVSETPVVNLSEAASAELAVKPGTKTVIRVRKVLKKKIVKKLVPKGSLTSKKAESSEKDLNPNSVLDSSIQEDVVESTSKSNDTNQQSESLNTAPEANDTVEIREECQQMKAKDDGLKSKKVVRKKIVKKLVPKGSLRGKNVDAVLLKNGSMSLPEISDKDHNLSSSPDNPIQQDVSEKTFNSDIDQLQEAEMVGDMKLESGKTLGNVDIKEECGQTKAVDDNLESGKEGDLLEAAETKEQEAMHLSERMKRRKTEIFIGGLDRDAKEEDIRNVFGKVGEILEIRVMMDGQTGKNKGYAFLRYVDPKHAKRAVTEFSKVEIRGKICGAAAVQGNDTIFLGNIDKNWKKEDVMKLLKDGGIENIDTVTVVMDPNISGSNRGFAFLELETNKDAQRAYKKLQMKDALGKGRNIKVAWAGSFNTPDEEDMLKVKSVYAEGVPDSWDEDKLMETFKKFGEIERIVLGKNVKSAKRRDIAFINYKTREAALSCIESLSSDDLIDNGSKVNLKVTLAKRVQKGNQSKLQKSSVNYPLKEAYNPVLGLPQDYTQAVLGAKRTYSALGDGIYSDLRGYPRTRLDGNFGVASSSYTMMPHGGIGSSLHYQHQPLPVGVGYTFGSVYGSGSRADAAAANQATRQGGALPHTGSLYYYTTTTTNNNNNNNRYQM